MPTGNGGAGVTLGIAVEIDNQSKTSVQEELADLAKGLEGGKDGKDVFKRLTSGIEGLRGALKTAVDLSREFGAQWAANLKQLEKQNVLMAQIAAQKGAGGGGGGNQADEDGLTEQARDPHPRRRWNSVAMGLATGVNTLHSMMQQGFSSGSFARGVGDVANSQAMVPYIGPWGPLVHAVGNTSADITERTEDFGEQKLQMQRAGGLGARDTFSNVSGRGLTESGLQEETLLSRAEMFRLMQGLVKGTGDASNLGDTARLEGGYGLGGEATQLLSTLRHGGVQTKGEAGSRELAQSIGLALAEGLERGRVGEAFQMMSRLASSPGSGIANAEQVERTAQFIGTSGEQYKGNTQQAQSMAGVIQGLANAQGGGKGFALMAAGLGSGKSYAEAELALSRGVDKDGGVSGEALVRSYAENGIIKRLWQQNPEDAAMVMAQISHQPIGVVRDVLENYYGKGFRGLTSEQEAAARKVLDENSKFDTQDAQQRYNTQRKERAYNTAKWVNFNMKDSMEQAATRLSNSGAPFDPIGAVKDYTDGGGKKPAAIQSGTKAPTGAGPVTHGAKFSGEAQKVLEEMDAKFFSETGRHLELDGKMSGLRTQAEQDVLHEHYVRTGKGAASKAVGRHGTGEAMDFNTKVPGAKAWLQKHVSEYSLQHDVKHQNSDAWYETHDDGHYEINRAALGARWRKPKPDAAPATAVAAAPAEQPAQKVQVDVKTETEVRDSRVRSVTKAAARQAATGVGMKSSGANG